jgi:hypothetical protein
MWPIMCPLLVATIMLLGVCGHTDDHPGVYCTDFDGDCAGCVNASDSRAVWASQCVFLSGPVEGNHTCQASKWWWPPYNSARLFPDVHACASCPAPPRWRRDGVERSCLALPPPPPPSAHIWFWAPLPCCDAAGLPIACPEPVTISGTPPRWHGEGANCSFLPRSVLQKARTGPPFMTGAFACVGHSIQDNGTFVLPSENSAATLKRDIRDLHALNITVEPMIAGATQLQLAALLYNKSAREGFISAFVHDAVQNGYDGYHLDWEFGDINASESVMYAQFLLQFKRALPPPLRLSAAVGGFWKKSGTAPTKAAVNVDVPTLKGSDVVLYSMDTYDGEDDVFSRNIATGSANVGRPQPRNWGVGLAWSATSWPAPMYMHGPQPSNIQLRFDGLRQYDVRRVAMFGGNSDNGANAFMDRFMPHLQAFVAGKSDDELLPRRASYLNLGFGRSTDGALLDDAIAGSKGSDG